MLIEILVFRGVDELDFVGPLEVLRNAANRGADFKMRVVALSSNEAIQANHGLRFSVDGTLGSTGRPDLLLVPGGGWVRRARHGAWVEAQNRAIPDAIARLHRSGTILAGVCTGTMLLAAAGVLRGRRATTHRLATEDLRAAGVEVISARVVDDGEIITSGGVTSGLDLALYLTERFANREMADLIAENLEYERRGPVHVSSATPRDTKGQVAQ